MTAKLTGGGLILAGAVYVLWLWYRRRRRQREVLWSLVGALGYMETAIRWQRMPLPQIIWLVGLFLTPTPTAIIMPTKQSTPAAPIPATRTKAAVPGAATDQKS